MGQEEHPTNVGTTRPKIRQDWILKGRVSRFLARCEFGAAHLFYWFNSVALFRLLIRAFTVVVLLVTLWAIYDEFQQRKMDRGVRVATLFAQIAEVHALPAGRGLRALKPSVEGLAREGVRMWDIDLSRAVLTGAKLSGADLSGADLSYADLIDAELDGATLSHAKLVGAKLLSANLTDAKIFEADISGAVIGGETGLDGEQLSTACAAPDNPPIINPESLRSKWRPRPCREHME